MRLPGRLVAAIAGATIAGAALLPLAAVQAEGPTLVAFAIDTSGSLRPADLARASELASGILRELPGGTESALFTFDDQARMVVRRTSRPEEVVAALAALRRQGRRTALNDALYDATRYLRDAAAGPRALVLITDGRDEDSAVELGDGLAVAQQAGIPVFTIGVGRVEERVLRRVAKLTGGQYTPLASARAGMIAARITTFDLPESTAVPSQRSTRGEPAPPPAGSRGAPSTPGGMRLVPRSPRARETAHGR